MTDTINALRTENEQLHAALHQACDWISENTAEIAALRAENEDLRAALEQPQVEQEPFTVLVRKHSWLANQWEAAPRGLPDYGKSWADERINVYTHPQNLRCKSNQARLATLWGYVKPQPKREPLIGEAECQCPYPKSNPSTYNAWLDGWEAAERTHGIGGEA